MIRTIQINNNHRIFLFLYSREQHSHNGDGKIMNQNSSQTSRPCLDGADNF